MTDEALVTFLTASGPSLSSTLAAELERRFQISPAAARKRIERAKANGALVALQNLKFRRNEQFVFTPEQQGTPLFRTALLKALNVARSAYRFPLAGINSRGGVVPKYLSSTFSGLPVSGNMATANKVCHELLELELLQEVMLPIGNCLFISDTIRSHKPNVSRLKARLLVENFLLYVFRDWLRLQGLISNEASSLRGSIDPPQFGYHHWDLVAPSYISPFVEPLGRKGNGFVVADVILGRKLSTADIEYFVHKSSVIRSRPGHRPFIPFLIADWFEKDAFAQGRRQGLILTTPKNLFGPEFMRLLDCISQCLEVRELWAETIERQLTEMKFAIDNLRHLDSTESQLKPILFQLLVGLLASKMNPSWTIFFDHVVSTDSKPGERHFDVGLQLSNERIILVDCKPNKRLPSLNFLREWLQHIEAVLSSLRRDPSMRRTKIEFQLWLSVNCPDKAMLTLPDYVRIYDRSDFLNLCDRLPVQGVRDVFEHWFNPDRQIKSSTDFVTLN